MKHRVVAVLAALALVSGGAAIVRAVDVAMSCLPAEAGQIRESNEYTAYGDRLTTRPEPVFKAISEQADPGTARLPGDSLDGLQLVRVTIGPRGEVFQSFGARPIEAGKPVSDFLTEGGIRYNVTQSDAAYIDEMVASFPGRTVLLEVGGSRALLTWSDPDLHGARPHRIYWESDGLGHELIAVRPAHALVNLARTIQCT